MARAASAAMAIASLLVFVALLPASCARPQSNTDRLTWNRITADDDNALEGPERYSGYFKLNRTYDAHMFFFFFEARNDPDNAPVVLWMTGGPGCSSELAVFYENGPWTIDEDLSLVETAHGWDKNHNMIYVDQPINTGFSYSEDERDRCYDEVCVSNDMVDFMSALFKARPELQDNDFFVTGESYAGHYVPAVASGVYHASKSGELSPPINLKGLAIGNGLTVPSIQYGAYGDYALQHQLIDSGVAQAIDMLYAPCRLALEVCDGTAWNAECLFAVQFCQSVTFLPVMILNSDMNVYDIRKKCEGPLCYDFSRMDAFLNRADVRRKLGVGDRSWEACSPSVHEDMMGDWGHRFDKVLPELMKSGVRVMIYAGVDDFICNVLGNQRWVDALEWPGSADWAAAAEEPWTVGGEDAGTVRSTGPLSFVAVNGAGHMVPMDRPREAEEMIYRFTRGQPLATRRSGGAGTLQRGAAVQPRKLGPQVA